MFLSGTREPSEEVKKSSIANCEYVSKGFPAVQANLQ